MSARSREPSWTQEETVIGVPEGGVTHAPPRFGIKHKPLEVVVYFPDKTGIHLSVADGQHCDARELFEIVRDEMKLPPEAREVFSLWLVSDLLRLQLKPTHIPFKLVSYWEELLEKHTAVDEDDRERDEPVILFQRNVYFPCWKEKQINDAEMLRLLYHEAKDNIIEGRYPVLSEDYDLLAGVQALLQHTTFDPQEHTPEYYRSKLAEYYPEPFAKTKWKFPGIVRADESPEYRLRACHQQAFQRFGALDPEKVQQVHMAYLEACRELPFYGSAFFRGQTEHPSGTWRIRTPEDNPVYVAVNTEGVNILDMDDVEFLIGLPYKQVSWEYAEPRDPKNPDCMPCLFLQFAVRHDNVPVSKLLQIFSKEAQLADSLIEACIKLKESEKDQPHGDDGHDGKPRLLKASSLPAKYDRLCLVTFDQNGQVRSYPARVPKPN